MNELTIRLPDWVSAWLAERPPCVTDADKMRLALGLARANVEHGTGGPFGAVVCQGAAVCGVGVNVVPSLNNSVLHAEIMALMLAEARLGSFSLRQPPHELFTSCDPCAMCLGAILWSGVTRVVCGADRSAASRIGFDEGPVFPESYAYLQARGITVERGVLAADAAAVFDLYQKQGGRIYNAG